MPDLASRDAVLCFDDYVGPGYSLPTDGMVVAVKMLVKTEAILRAGCSLFTLGAGT